MTHYYRPIVRSDIARPITGLPVAGGPCWVSEIEVLSRSALPIVIPIQEAPRDCVAAITSSRAPVAGLTLEQPRLMGILNVTPDSFSNDGVFAAPKVAVQTALNLVKSGADIIDIGGESTRPGSETVTEDEEIGRTALVIATLREQTGTPISIDTRKSSVARSALDAGANLVNDVSGFTFDLALSGLCVERQTPICVMHAQGDPATMQADPCYDDVLLDVYDFLATQIDKLVAAGIARNRILADPGIGFGKTRAHNLALLRRISLFHTLGCPILLGASRKRFIGTIGKGAPGSDRAPGSIAVGLAALTQGVQILRVHDVEMTKQAIRLHNAVTTRGEHD